MSSPCRGLFKISRPLLIGPTASLLKVERTPTPKCRSGFVDNSKRRGTIRN